MVLDGQVRQYGVKEVEIVYLVRIVGLKLVEIHPGHLLAASSEVPEGADKLLGQVWMLSEGIIDRKEPLILTLEELIPQLDELDVAAEVLGNT